MTAVSHPHNSPVDHADATLAQPSEPGTESPAAPPGPLKSPVLQGGIAFLIYLVIWMTTGFRPIVSHLTWMRLHEKSQDPSIFAWSLRWWPYAIGHGLNPLYTHEVMAPAGHSLAWVTTVPPLALLVAPLTLAAGSVVSFNLLATVAAPLSAWAAFLLCRRLTAKFWAALAGGAVFGFSSFELYHSAWGQLNLAYCLLLPILGYIIVVWWQGRISTRAFVILAAVTMAVQFYLFMELFADMTAILAISLLVGFALAGPAGRPLIVRLAKFIGLAYVAAIVLVAPYIAYALGSKPPRKTPLTGTDLASLVIPQPNRTFGIRWLAHAAASAAGPNEVSTACYVGVPLLLLVVLLAVTRWQSRLVRFLSCMLVIVIVASLGPVVYGEGHPAVTLPWSVLFRLPLVSNALPLRLMVFAFLILAVATALWLAGPAKRVPWARWPLAALVIVFIALDAFPIKVQTHSEVPTFISTAQYRRQLSPGEIVVVVSNDGNTGMLWQAQSHFYLRISGGYINEGINHRTDLPRQVAVLRTRATPARVAEFEAFVKSGHVGAILVDVSNKPAPLWAGIFPLLGLVGHTTGGVAVYPTHGCDTCRVPTRAELQRGRAERRKAALAAG